MRPHFHRLHPTGYRWPCRLGIHLPMIVLVLHDALGVKGTREECPCRSFYWTSDAWRQRSPRYRNLATAV